MRRQERVLAQHHDLDYAMDRLMLLANAPTDLLNQRRLRYILEREFRKLAKRVLTHFDYEERDGYMSEVILNAPHLTHKVKELVKDHGRLRSLFKELETLSYEDGPIQGFRDRIRAALEAVREHEQAENSLLQSYLVDELGHQGD